MNMGPAKAVAANAAPAMRVEVRMMNSLDLLIVVDCEVRCLRIPDPDDVGRLERLMCQIVSDHCYCCCVLLLLLWYFPKTAEAHSFYI